MKKILLIILILPLSSYAQIYKHNRVFNDSLVFKNFNQGYLDSQECFNGTNDFLLGLVSTPIYFAPAAISFLVPPKNNRLLNIQNPNNEYLNLNTDYYSGYKYGARKKKQKRLIQGGLTPVAFFGTVIIIVLSSNSSN